MLEENPRRPPRKWMRDCVRGVEESGSGRNPGAVCGSLWYHKMTEAQRRAALRKEGKDEALSENPDPAGTLLAIAIGAVIIFGAAWFMKKDEKKAEAAPKPAPSPVPAPVPSAATPPPLPNPPPVGPAPSTGTLPTPAPVTNSNLCGSGILPYQFQGDPNVWFASFRRLTTWSAGKGVPATLPVYLEDKRYILLNHREIALTGNLDDFSKTLLLAMQTPDIFWGAELWVWNGSSWCQDAVSSNWGMPPGAVHGVRKANGAFREHPIRMFVL